MALKTISGIWKKQSKAGKAYLSMYMKGERAKDFIQELVNEFKHSGELGISIFPNGNKEKDNHPDYQFTLATQDETKDNGKADDFIS